MKFFLFTPNFLSVFRILLIPFFIKTLFIGSNYIFLAMGLFTIAVATDFYDGYFARKYNRVTKLGMFLDPLADKVLVLSTFISFYYLNLINLWVILIIFSRDFIVTFLRIFMVSKKHLFKTSYVGKVKTALQFTLIYVFFIYLILQDWIDNYVFFNVFEISIQFLIAFVLILTVYSGICYVVYNLLYFRRMFKKKFISNKYMKKIMIVFSNWFSTLLGAGYFPLCPGTLASLITVFFIFFIPKLTFIQIFLYLFPFVLIPLFFIGVYVSNETSKILNDSDPSCVVVDEVFGMSLVTLGLPKSILIYFVAFLLFRFFDITKIFPINWVEKNVKKGWGIMLDDFVAAIYSIIVLSLLRIFIFKC